MAAPWISQADMALIAAAADLAAAILPLALSQEDNPPPDVAVEDWRAAVRAARAALRKARGETDTLNPGGRPCCSP